MAMLEAPKFFINIMTEISSNSYDIFMNQHISSQQPYFQNSIRNEVWKCMQAKILDKNKILKCCNVIFLLK